MKIIEKIEIKHFRSFDGGVGQPKVEILDIKDLNIFSGANDSGKSNILRALNLFFNNEVLPGISFEIGRDLSKIQKTRSADKAKSKRDKGNKDVRQKDLWVKIKVFFVKETAGVLPQKFWVEKMWDKNGLHENKKHNIKENDDPKKTRAQEGQLTQFLNNIKFEYIPAVKDRQFFNFLFRKLQEYLFEKQDQKSENVFKTHSVKFNDLLKNETKKLFDEFKSNTGIEARFNIPETLVDFFRTLGVETENGISLFDRGDGIQARFIPDILNEISRDSRKKIIWGFEEPENSYEPLRCFELSQDFLKYSDDKQIFITTHAFPFIGLKGQNVSSYRVVKENGVSHIGPVDWVNRKITGLDLPEHAEELEKEMGILETYSKLSQHLGVEAQKPYLYVEGKWDKVYLEKAWAVLFPSKKIPFDIIDKGGSRIINAVEDISKESGNKKVVALFDRDKQGEEYFLLKINALNDLFEDVPKLSLTKKHKTKNIYITQIEAPPSRVNWIDANHKKILEMEHLFEDSFIQSIGIKIPPSITKTAKEWEASKDFKRKLGEKISSLSIPELKQDNFKNFNPMFEKIAKLFGLTL